MNPHSALLRMSEFPTATVRYRLLLLLFGNTRPLSYIYMGLKREVNLQGGAGGN
jgi:hypothetical protein